MKEFSDRHRRATLGRRKVSPLRDHKRRRVRRAPSQALHWSGILLGVIVASLFGLTASLALHYFNDRLTSATNPSRSTYARTVAPSSRRLGATATSIQVCPKYGRRITCLVDGDTGWERGIKWRLTSIDTPELSKPACAHENRKAGAALRRLRTLMSSGYTIDWLGRRGYYGRQLVNITLSDGRDAGDALLTKDLPNLGPTGAMCGAVDRANHRS